MNASVVLAPTVAVSARVRILEAARAHLFAYGYSALTMDALAHDLGMSKKTLYVYFPRRRPRSIGGPSDHGPCGERDRYVGTIPRAR